MYRSTSDYSLAPPSHSLIASPVHVIIPPHQHSNSNCHYRNRHVTVTTNVSAAKTPRIQKADGTADGQHIGFPHTLLHTNQSRLQRKQHPAFLLSSSSPFMLLHALIIQATFHPETLGHSHYAHQVAINHLDTAQRQTIDQTLSIAVTLGMLSLSALCCE